MIMARALAAKDPSAPPHALLAAATPQVVSSELLVGLRKHVICLTLGNDGCSHPSLVSNNLACRKTEPPTSERLLMLNIAIATISSQKLHFHRSLSFCWPFCLHPGFTASAVSNTGVH